MQEVVGSNPIGSTLSPAALSPEWFAHIRDAAAEVEVRWSADAARGILTRELRGNDALLATTVVASMVDGTYEGTPAPLNLRSRPELAQMPRIPGASIVVAYHY